MGKSAGSVSIIGGADGPTSILLPERRHGKTHKTHTELFLQNKEEQDKKADHCQSPYVGRSCGIAETGVRRCGSFSAVF